VSCVAGRGGYDRGGSRGFNDYQEQDGGHYDRGYGRCACTYGVQQTSRDMQAMHSGVLLHAKKSSCMAHIRSDGTITSGGADRLEWVYFMSTCEVQQVMVGPFGLSLMRLAACSRLACSLQSSMIVRVCVENYGLTQQQQQQRRLLTCVVSSTEQACRLSCP